MSRRQIFYIFVFLELLMILLHFVSLVFMLIYLCFSGFLLVIVTILSIGERGKYLCVQSLVWYRLHNKTSYIRFNSWLIVGGFFLLSCHASLQSSTCSSSTCLSSCLCGLTGRPSLPNRQTLPKRYSSDKKAHLHHPACTFLLA